MLNESSIIEFLKTQFPEKIGDDAAVLSSSPSEKQVITHDLLIEDVHFRLKYCGAENLAHKALHVNLSDVAAMGATPRYILLGLSAPKAATSIIHDFLVHFSKACKAQEVMLIGGDTTGSPDKLFISVTAIGYAKPSHLKYRHTAKPGDYLCMLGQPGVAHLGFMAFEQGKPGFDTCKTAFLKPHARIQEGIWLGQHAAVTSMMDVSDGLAVDLEKLTQSSNVSATLDLENLPKSEEFIATCQTLELSVYETQLAGGEDYGLLFTVAPCHYESFCAAFLKQFTYEPSRIGEIREGTGIIFLENNQSRQLKLNVFHHF
jgi:thiamine-monophosphate kinase